MIGVTAAAGAGAYFVRGDIRASGEKHESVASVGLQVLIPWPQEVRMMGKPTSSDLRERIVRGVASGHSCRAMAARFEVAPSTAVRTQQRYRATGVVAPSG